MSCAWPCPRGPSLGLWVVSTFRGSLLGRQGRTVVAALESVFPATRKELPTRISRLDPFKVVIDRILREDLDSPRKQRHTVKRVFDRLIDEHQANGLSYAMVRAPTSPCAPRRSGSRRAAGRRSRSSPRPPDRAGW